jgi:hypothetical protein
LELYGAFGKTIRGSLLAKTKSISDNYSRLGAFISSRAASGVFGLLELNNRLRATCKNI